MPWKEKGRAKAQPLVGERLLHHNILLANRDEKWYHYQLDNATIFAVCQKGESQKFCGGESVKGAEKEANFAWREADKPARRRRHALSRAPSRLPDLSGGQVQKTEKMVSFSMR